MRRKLPLIAIAAALLAVLVWLLFLRGGSKRPAAPPADPKAQTDDPWAKPRVADASHDQSKAPPAPIFLRDADPVGALRLEGQVLDANDQPVGGAEVWLGSVPPRQTRSEQDGSFAFDKLVGRVYALEARHGDDVGGPLTYTLTSSSDPAVIRLRKGQVLTVIVTGTADGKPIAGATVATRGLAEQQATTGADGKAALHAIAPGWLAVTVSARGFAPRHAVDEIKEGQTELRVQLDRGAAIAGRVVDEQGKPIANAHVIARDVASLIPLDDPQKDGATTDDQGAFTLPAVAAGSYRLLATDDEHAPGSSEPITVDGESPRTGVTITMKTAAVLTGHVVTREKQPAPYATIKVAPKEGPSAGLEQLASSSRQVVADADGKFTLKGLPRAAMRVRAESDVAASPIADVDLTAGATKELELVLDVSGTIAGTVVDAGGQPVAEAQVSAMSDFLGGGGKVEDLAISGFAQATTDGGGRFALHGLPDGAYRLWAHRAGGSAQPFEREGTPAKTGETNVKIVLPAPGGLAGKVAFDDGRAVSAGTASVGFQSSAAIVDGAFELHDLAPGAYDLKLRGADFAEVTRAVTVEAGKTTDLGTITVKRGRRVTGRVIASDGSPAAGAKVAIGKLLIADGRALGMGGVVSDDQMGMRTTTVAADGSFAIIGVGPDGGSILADHPSLGRSDTLTVPPGTDDPAPITLRLHGFGSLTGKVTLAGEPVASTTVMVSPKAGGDASIIVTTGADGTYLIEKIPEGQHHATVMRNSGMGASMTSADTTIVAGRQTRLDIDIPQGDVTLTVEVHGKDGAKVDAAEIFVAGGTVTIANGKELQAAVLHGAGTGGGGVKVWLGGPDFPAFEKLTAGPYSICTLPITGNIADPRVATALQDHGDKLDVYCAPFTLKPDPKQQRFVHEVPAMKPLPPN